MVKLRIYKTERRDLCPNYETPSVATIDVHTSGTLRILFMRDAVAADENERKTNRITAINIYARASRAPLALERGQSFS